MPDLNVNVFRINRTSKTDPVMHFLCFFLLQKISFRTHVERNFGQLGTFQEGRQENWCGRQVAGGGKFQSTSTILSIGRPFQKPINHILSVRVLFSHLSEVEQIPFLLSYYLVKRTDLLLSVPPSPRRSCNGISTSTIWDRKLISETNVPCFSFPCVVMYCCGSFWFTWVWTLAATSSFVAFSRSWREIL